MTITVPYITGDPYIDADFAAVAAGGDASTITYTPPFTGAVATNVAAKLAQFPTLEDFGAVGDGVTDDHAAIAAAALWGGWINCGAKTYRSSAAITIPVGTFFFSESAPAISTGCIFLFDNAVAGAAVTLGGASAGNGTLGFEGICIKRAGGAPPANTIGVLIEDCYTPRFGQIMSYNHAIGYKFYSSDGVTGISAEISTLYSGAISDAHVVVDTWPELRINNSRFGTNGAGDLSCTTYVRIQGGSAVHAAAGPNTVVFTNTQFNQGANTASYLCDWVNQTASSIADTVEYIFGAGCHVEAIGTAYFHSDSTWTSITRFQLSDSYFNNVKPMFALNSATTPNNWNISNMFHAGSVTLAPASQMNYVSMNGCNIVGNVSITGVSSSTYISTGNNIEGTVTYAGSFAQLVSLDISGTVTNSATGTTPGSIYIAGISAYGTWSPVIAFGGSSTGITYTRKAGSYQRIGAFIIAQFSIILSSKGSATGNATMTLPFSGSSSFSSDGGVMSCIATGMSSLSGGVTAQVNLGSSTVTFATWSSAGSVTMTDTNFTNTSQVTGTITYQVQ